MSRDYTGGMVGRGKLTIGEAARRAAVTPKAIRLYESRGLLPDVERTASRYRLYSEKDIEVLCFIRQAKSLDLTLDEVKEIVRLDDGLPCDRVKELLDGHITKVDQTMRDLNALRRRLVAARSDLGAPERADAACICPIIESQAV